jgi:hypothetical protein
MSPSGANLPTDAQHRHHSNPHSAAESSDPLYGFPSTNTAREVQRCEEQLRQNANADPNAPVSDEYLAGLPPHILEIINRNRVTLALMEQCGASALDDTIGPDSTPAAKAAAAAAARLRSARKTASLLGPMVNESRGAAASSLLTESGWAGNDKRVAGASTARGISGSRAGSLLHGSRGTSSMHNQQPRQSLSQQRRDPSSSSTARGVAAVAQASAPRSSGVTLPPIRSTALGGIR